MKRKRYAESENAYHRKKYIEFKIRLDQIKNVPCMDCRESFPPECMDFDHRIPAEKNRSYISISNMYSRSEKQIQEELAKCDIICSNCHRTRTKIRNQYKDYTPRLSSSKEEHPPVERKVGMSEFL